MSEQFDPKYDLSREGRELVKAYQTWLEATTRAKQAYDRALANQADARRALVKWCSPGDAHEGEKFGIWSRDQYDKEVMIEVKTACGAEESTVNFRYRK